MVSISCIIYGSAICFRILRPYIWWRWSIIEPTKLHKEGVNSGFGEINVMWTVQDPVERVQMHSTTNHRLFRTIRQGCCYHTTWEQRAGIDRQMRDLGGNPVVGNSCGRRKKNNTKLSKRELPTSWTWCGMAQQLAAWKGLAQRTALFSAQLNPTQPNIGPVCSFFPEAI